MFMSKRYVAASIKDSSSNVKQQLQTSILKLSFEANMSHHDVSNENSLHEMAGFRGTDSTDLSSFSSSSTSILSNQLLCVIGKKYKINENDAMANYFHQGKHLIGSDKTNSHHQTHFTSTEQYDLDLTFHERDGEDIGNTMDPHDARLLLDPLELSNFSSPKLDECKLVHCDETIEKSNDILTDREMETAENEDELQFERFGLLPEYRNKEKKENTKRIDTCQKKIAQDVGFSRHDDLTFLQSARENIILPSTRRQYDIMKKTAQNVYCNAQFQVLLKLKQSHNPDFTFMNFGNSLHPLYEYMMNQCKTLSTINETENDKQGEGPLLDYPSSNEEVNNSSDEEESSNMKGLFGMYASSDEEQSDGEDKLDETKSSLNLDNEKGFHIENFNEDTICLGEKRKATSQTEIKRRERLKRVKMKKDHFLAKIKNVSK